MHSRLMPVSRSFVVLSLIGFVGCYAPHSHTRAATELIAAKLESCPSWRKIPEGDRDGTAKLLQRLGELSRYDVNTLRGGIVQFVRIRESQNKLDIDSMCKLFLLNRYLFDVPPVTDRATAGSFGGWYGVPENDGNVQLMWPLRIDENGEMELVGNSVGFLGEPYQAVEEFDYFYRRFGLRHKAP